MSIKEISARVKDQLIKLTNSHTSIINQSQSFRQYIEKCRSQKIDNEESIVQPFTISFLRFLNYINQHNLRIEIREDGDKPDFYSDKFILECKSSKYSDFSETMGREESPEEQLERYLKSKGFSREYGILFSVDRFEVYQIISDKLTLIEDLTFSLVNLYDSCSTNFERFLKMFYCSPLTIDEKIEVIASIEKKDLGFVRK